MKKLLLFIMIVLILVSCAKQGPKYYPIVDKYEVKDKHYLVLSVEVTPEEYIGYDIGDDYEVKHD